MGLYILNFFSLAIHKIVFEKRERIICVLFALQLFLLLALRSSLLGDDLDNYSAGFEYISTLSFSDLLSRFSFFRMALLEPPFSYESGFVFLNWIVASLGGNFHVFLVVCAAINILCLAHFLWHFSSNCVISYSLFMALGMYSYCFGILRQSLSIAIIMEMIIAIDKKKLCRSLIMFLLAFLIHRVAIISLAYLFFRDWRITKRLYSIVFSMCIILPPLMPIFYQKIVCPVLLMFGHPLYTNISFHINKQYVLLVFLTLWMLLFVDFDMFKDFKMNLLGWGWLFSMLIGLIGLCNDVFSRSIEVYLICGTALIPNQINNFKRCDTRQYHNLFVFSFSLLAYYFIIKDSVIVPYIFCFQ